MAECEIGMALVGLCCPLEALRICLTRCAICCFSLSELSSQATLGLQPAP